MIEAGRWLLIANVLAGIVALYKFGIHANHTTVSLTVTSKGRTLASGKVDIPITQDYVTDASTHKTADCGGGGLITVTAEGHLKAERLR